MKKVPRVPLWGFLRCRQPDSATTLLKLHQTYGPFLKMPIGQRFMVASPEIVQHILLTNMDNYTKDSVDYRLLDTLLGSGLLTSEGDRWQKQRQVMQPLFHLREMPSYFVQSQQTLTRFVNYWRQQCQAKQPVDIVLDMMALSMMLTCQCLFAYELEVPQAQQLVQDFFYQHAHVCKTGNSFNWLPLPSSIKYKSCKRRTDNFTKKLFAHVRQVDRPTVISQMQGFSEQDIFDQAVTILATGHETTGLGLAWSWYLLAKNPHCEAKLLQELEQQALDALQYEDLDRFDYTHAVFQEAIRLYPPIWALPRTAIKADNIHGYAINPGSKFIINIYSLQRYPDYWQDVESFKPERFSKAERQKRHKYAYIPFGAGPHVCVANVLALMQARLSLVTLAKQFRLALLEPAQQVGVKTYISLKPDQPIMMTLQQREIQS